MTESVLPPGRRRVRGPPVSVCTISRPSPSAVTSQPTGVPCARSCTSARRGNEGADAVQVGTDVRTVDTVWGLQLRAEVHLTARVDEEPPLAPNGEVVAVDGGEVLAARFVATDELPEGMLPAHRRRVAIWEAAREGAGPPG